MPNTRSALVLATLATYITALGGCASHYVTPGDPAPLMQMAAREQPGVDARPLGDPAVTDRMAVAPAANWPANLAFARIQGSGYRAYGSRGVGGGR